MWLDIYSCLLFPNFNGEICDWERLKVFSRHQLPEPWISENSSSITRRENSYAHSQTRKHWVRECKRKHWGQECIKFCANLGPSMLNSIQNVKFIKVSQLNVFHRCLCSTSYHVKHLCHVRERLDENKIKFFSTDLYILPRGSIKASTFQKNFACA